jgi:hypothetical protein
MTEKPKDGGSGSAGAGDSAAQGVQDVGRNKTVKLSMDEALAKIERLTTVGAEKDQLLADVTAQLKEANDFISGERKSKKINFLLAATNFKMDELVPKTDEELDSMITTVQQAKMPHVNSARFGVQGAGLSNAEKNLTVGDRSWATEQKRKAAAGVA